MYKEKDKKSLQNSGGVYVRRCLLNDGFISRICTDFTDCIVLYVKSRVFRSMVDMTIYITYISPAGSSIYKGMEEKNGIICLFRNIEKLKACYKDCLFYIADLNARTKTFLDYIPDDTLNYIELMLHQSDSFQIICNNKD